MKAPFIELSTTKGEMIISISSIAVIEGVENGSRIVLSVCDEPNVNKSLIVLIPPSYVFGQIKNALQE